MDLNTLSPTFHNRCIQSSEFKNISLTGNKFYSKTTLLLSNPTPEEYFCNSLKNKNAKEFCRIGFTVSKTVGNAVARNLAKRRLREAVRELFPTHAKNHHDYVIIARKEIAQAEYEKILADLKCL